MKSFFAGLCTATAMLVAAAPAAIADDRDYNNRSNATVYVASNSPSGNTILMYEQRRGGLAAAGEVPTDGLGTGTGLGNQGGLATTNNGRTLLAVNAGSNDVSVFRVHRRGGLRLTDRFSSGGTMPVSIATHDDLVYVLNAGSDSISGFRLHRNKLRPIAGSTLPLSGSGTGPAQIGFSPSGDTLLVTEKATNKIVAYAVNRHGVASGPIVHDSNGQTPFGFAFDRRGHALVSEAFGGTAAALSSYDVSRRGAVRSISASIDATGQRAACWVAITRNGKFAYITNTATNSVSSYAVERDGSLRLLSSVAATTAAGPIDMDFSDDGQTLFVLTAGGNAIQAFDIDRWSGNLTAAETVTGLPAGANGLIAQ